MVHRFYTIRTLFLCLGCSISLLFACQTVTSGTLDSMYLMLGDKPPIRPKTSLSESTERNTVYGSIPQKEIDTYNYQGINYYNPEDPEASQEARALIRNNETKTFALTILTPLLLLIGVIIAGAKWIRGL